MVRIMYDMFQTCSPLVLGDNAKTYTATTVTSSFRSVETIYITTLFLFDSFYRLISKSKTLRGNQRDCPDIQKPSHGRGHGGVRYDYFGI